MQTWFHVQLDRKILKGLYSTHHCVNIFPPAGRLMMGRILNRDLPRFFDQVGHQTTNASIGSTFSLNNVIVRFTKIMNRADKNWAHF